MQKEISPKITALTFGILAVAFLAAFYVIAWQEPTQAPPGGNVATPINIGPTGQSKEGGLILNTGGAANGLVVDKGESQFPSITIIGGASLPICNSSYRGKQFLLQGGSGTEDGLYICKKKADSTYAWVALASPKIIYAKRYSTGQWEALEAFDRFDPMDPVEERVIWGVNGNAYKLKRSMSTGLYGVQYIDPKVVLKNGSPLIDNYAQHNGLLYGWYLALGLDMATDLCNYCRDGRIAFQYDSLGLGYNVFTKVRSGCKYDWDDYVYGNKSYAIGPIMCGSDALIDLRIQ